MHGMSPRYRGAGHSGHLYRSSPGVTAGSIV
jgi:hypothetical protein